MEATIPSIYLNTTDDTLYLVKKYATGNGWYYHVIGDEVTKNRSEYPELPKEYIKTYLGGSLDLFSLGTKVSYNIDNSLNVEHTTKCFLKGLDINNLDNPVIPKIDGFIDYLIPINVERRSIVGAEDITLNTNDFISVYYSPGQIDVIATLKTKLGEIRVLESIEDNTAENRYLKFIEIVKKYITEYSPDVYKYFMITEGI